MSKPFSYWNEQIGKNFLGWAMLGVAIIYISFCFWAIGTGLNAGDICHDNGYDGISALGAGYGCYMDQTTANGELCYDTIQQIKSGQEGCK